MYCPKCGKSDQQPESYCRQCGTYLPDLSQPAKKRQTPQDHVRANIVLNSMTIVAAFTLAVLQYVFLAFRPGTHPLTYVTAGILLAIGCWHTQTLWRTLLLRRHLQRAEPAREIEAGTIDLAAQLPSGDRFAPVPGSVTERTTRHLEGSRQPSPEAKH